MKRINEIYCTKRKSTSAIRQLLLKISDEAINDIVTPWEEKLGGHWSLTLWKKAIGQTWGMKQGPKARVFLFKCLTRRLGTNSLVQHFDEEVTGECARCWHERKQWRLETIEHLFIDCPSATRLYQQLSSCREFTDNFEVILNNKFKIMIYQYDHDWSITQANTANIITTWLKQYMYKCKMTTQKYTLLGCLKYFQKHGSDYDKAYGVQTFADLMDIDTG